MTEGQEPIEASDEKDLPLDEDLEDDEDVEMVRCPHCYKFIYEETIKCPHCEEWIIDRPSNEFMRSKWFWPILIAMGLVMIFIVWVVRLVG